MARKAAAPIPDTLYEAHITGLDHEGYGVARTEGKVVFIDGALPGEQVRYRLRRQRSKFNNAYVVDIIESAPERVLPACEYFGVCGGCSLQHLNTESQVQAKHERLVQALQHTAKIEPQQWLPAITGPSWGYRRKARIGAKLVPKKGGILIGFRERRSNFLTDLQHCEVLDARIAKQLPDLHDLIGGLSCPDKIPQIEVAAGDDEVAMVFRHMAPLGQDDVASMRRYAETHAIQLYLQPKGPDSIHVLWPVDPAPLSYRLPQHDIEIRFAPTDFIQVNVEVNRQMVDRVLELLAPSAEEQVLDLFCGLGNFTLPLARHAHTVVGVEASQALVNGARANATHNHIANAEFMVADLYDETAPLPWEGRRFDKLLLDPPRSGALPVLKRLAPDLPGRIVYVSCNPATLARDCAYLVQDLGYRLTHAGIMDMFPHTSHVEAMAVFERE